MKEGEKEEETVACLLIVVIIAAAAAAEKEGWERRLKKESVHTVQNINDDTETGLRVSWLPLFTLLGYT